MKYLLLLGLIISNQSHANMTCRGAVEYALADILALNEAMEISISPEEVSKRMIRENGRVRDVVIACGVRDTEAKNEYCSVVPRLLKLRGDLIDESTELSKKSKRQLLMKLADNQEIVRITCP